MTCSRGHQPEMGGMQDHHPCHSQGHQLAPETTTRTQHTHSMHHHEQQPHSAMPPQGPEPAAPPRDSEKMGRVTRLTGSTVNREPTEPKRTSSDGPDPHLNEAHPLLLFVKRKQARKRGAEALTADETGRQVASDAKRATTCNQGTPCRDSGRPPETAVDSHTSSAVHPEDASCRGIHLPRNSTVLNIPDQSQANTGSRYPVYRLEPTRRHGAPPPVDEGDYHSSNHSSTRTSTSQSTHRSTADSAPDERSKDFVGEHTARTFFTRGSE